MNEPRESQGIQDIDLSGPMSGAYEIRGAYLVDPSKPQQPLRDDRQDRGAWRPMRRFTEVGHE